MWETSSFYSYEFFLFNLWVLFYFITCFVKMSTILSWQIIFLPRQRKICTEIVWSGNIRTTKDDNLHIWFNFLNSTMFSSIRCIFWTFTIFFTKYETVKWRNVLNRYNIVRSCVTSINRLQLYWLGNEAFWGNIFREWYFVYVYDMNI